MTLIQLIVGGSADTRRIGLIMLLCLSCRLKVHEIGNPHPARSYHKKPSCRGQAEVRMGSWLSSVAEPASPVAAPIVA